MDTTHAPIQRFSAYHSGDPHKVGLWADGGGHWVTYADHVEAVRQARADERKAAARDALAAVREVEPVRDVDYPLHLIERREVLAAIAAALGEGDDDRP